MGSSATSTMGMPDVERSLYELASSGPGSAAGGSPGFVGSLLNTMAQNPDKWLRAGSALLPRSLQPLANIGAGATEIGMMGGRNQDYLAALATPEAQRTPEQKALILTGAPRQAPDVAGSMATDVAKARSQAQQTKQEQARNAGTMPMPIPPVSVAPFRPTTPPTPLMTSPQATMQADPMTVLLQQMLMAQQPKFMSGFPGGTSAG